MLNGYVAEMASTLLDCSVALAGCGLTTFELSIRTLPVGGLCVNGHVRYGRDLPHVRLAVCLRVYEPHAFLVQQSYAGCCFNRCDFLLFHFLVPQTIRVGCCGFKAISYLLSFRNSHTVALCV